MNNKLLLWVAYLVLGALWNAGMWMFMALRGDMRMQWYQALGAGLLAGGPLCLAGETVLRWVDIGLRKESILGFISPSFWLRLIFSIVPGTLARAMFARPGTNRSARFDTFVDPTKDWEVILRCDQGSRLTPGDKLTLRGVSYTVLENKETENGDRTYTVRSC